MKYCLEELRLFRVLFLLIIQSPYYVTLVSALISNCRETETSEVGVTSNGITSPPNFMNIGQTILKFTWEHTRWPLGDFKAYVYVVSLRKSNRPKMISSKFVRF